MLRAIWTRSTLSSVRWHSELPKKSREQIMKDKTPKGVLDRSEEDPKPYQDPNLPKHPGGINPNTGEVGGPAGPEPTRFGDWERKGRNRMLSMLCSEAAMNPESALEKAFSCPSVINFAPLLEIPKIKELAAKNSPLYKTLHVFAYGTIEDLPNGVELPPACLTKLRQLSLITYASQNRELSYEDLIRKFGITSRRDLEDLVIDAIYSNLIKARLDSVKGLILVDDWMARDVVDAETVIPDIAVKLNDWLTNAENTQRDALQNADSEDRKMRDAAEYKKATAKQINDAKQAIEEAANRVDPFARPREDYRSDFRTDFSSFPMLDSSTNGTPRSKRRNPLSSRGNRMNK